MRTEILRDGGKKMIEKNIGLLSVHRNEQTRGSSCLNQGNNTFVLFPHECIARTIDTGTLKS